MRYIDLFGGVGGFSLAIKRATNNLEEAQSQSDKESWADSPNIDREPSAQGWSKSSTSDEWQCVGYYEIDKYAVQTYNKNFGTGYKPTDIAKLDTADIPDFDFLCAGFPCQAFSIAGKRKGFQDTRGTLFFEICRIAKDKRPSYLLLENVKGLLSHDEGRTFFTIISSLDELGYDCQWQVLNSKFFGVPQNRERVFIIGHLRGKPRPEVFPFGQGSSNIAEKYGEGNSESQTLTATYYNGGKGEHIQVINTQPRSPDRPSLINNTSQGGSGILIKEDETYCLDNQNSQAIRVINRSPSGVEQIARIYDKEGISPTLQTPSGGHHIPKIAIKDKFQKTVYDANGIAPVMREGHGDGIRIMQARLGHTKSEYAPLVYESDVTRTLEANASLAVMDNKIRRLTPKECERLQSFPDDWTAGVSDTQRYKQMGNAITVNVVEHIIKKWRMRKDEN